MEKKKNIIFLELPFDGFTVNLAWIPYDKAANEVARIIVRESFLYKRKLEQFITENKVKEPEVYVLACGKEYSIKRGFTEDFELVDANIIVFKKPFQGVFDRAIHISLEDDFENYESREELKEMIFTGFFHELLHGVCKIMDEEISHKIADEFNRYILPVKLYRFSIIHLEHI